MSRSMLWIAAVITVIAVIAVVHPTLAAAEACEAGALRVQLEHEHHRAQTWRHAWGIGFGIAAIGQAVGAAVIDDREQRDTLLVGAIKSGIGALSQLVLPLRIEVPAVNPEACAEARQLNAALVEARRAEKAGFWLDHVGGFLVNAVGAIVLAHYTNWSTGAISFALGYPVGLISTYTMPRWAWHAAPIDHGAAIGVTVAF